MGGQYLLTETSQRSQAGTILQTPPEHHSAPFGRFLHVPARRTAAAVRDLIDARRLAVTRRIAVLVNTAHGDLNDENALAAALSRSWVDRALINAGCSFDDGPRLVPPALAITRAGCDHKGHAQHRNLAMRRQPLDPGAPWATR